MPKRFKFFIKHLSISLLISLLVVGLVFLIWYPTPLVKAVGVTYIFLMILGIDVIIGPVLGFLVYKESKKSLRFDLTVIIFLQLLAFCYGVYSIAEGRPTWLVYNLDRFELVRKNEIVDQNIKQAKPQFQQPSWLKPQFVATEFAKNTQQRNDDMFAEVFGGISLAQRPERYVDFVEAKKQIQQRAQKLELLQQYNNKTDVDKILAKYPQAVAFFPLKASAVDMTVLINKETTEIVEIVDLRPWH
jgi:hypothetical protein